jgi:hypothetical protein
MDSLVLYDEVSQDSIDHGVELRENRVRVMYFCIELLVLTLYHLGVGYILLDLGLLSE